MTEMDCTVDDNQIKEVLDDHGNRIAKLELTTAKMEERFSKIDYQLSDVKSDVGELKTELRNGLTRMENVMLVNFNSLLDFKKNKENNKTQLLMRGLKITGSAIFLLILGYFAGRGIQLPMP